MKTQHVSRQQGLKPNWIIILIGLLLLSALISCNFTPSDDTGASVEQTQTMLNIQQTQTAQQATSNALDAQATAQAAPPVAPPDLAATQVALSVQATLAAQQQPPPQPPAQTVPPVAPVQTVPPQAPPAPADFREMMKSATVLLFEDIVADPSQSRFVKKTLDAMGIRYKDDGNAIGWLKSDLLGNAPNGQPWDLVILAIEDRGEVSGEYFEYLNEVLNKGSAVIVEAWHLDAISEGTVSTILVKCGVQVYPYFPKTGTVNDVVLWPLPESSQNPIMNEPNAGLTFTKANDTWLWTFDLGSLMALTGQKDAQLLIGTKASSNFQDGALASCMGGQLTLQTFSSHSFPYQVMGPLWENYIYNALRWKLLGGG